jgi:signal transduction histidine kinase
MMNVGQARHGALGATTTREAGTVSETTPGGAPRIRRAPDGRIVAGVCVGVARHLGLDTLVVRLAFVLLVLAGGLGVALYVALWILLPHDHDDAKVERDYTQLAAYAALTVGIVFLGLLAGGLFSIALWPVVAGAAGGAILWQQAGPDQREQWARTTTKQIRRTWLRSIVGVALVAGGILGFLLGSGQLAQAGRSLAATGVILIGLGLVAAPWIMRLVRELYEERGERIRSQERAEVAAHVHDSVLHTLTLIQRNADDPREVQRLARAQERELRTWLYQPKADADATLAAAVEKTAAQVEEAHGLPIEAVSVGDCPLDDRLGAALQAAREAMVNAAKYSGAPSVSVFAEVEPEQVTIFVRDRGNGFDMSAIPDDRMGVRQSIVGRMERNGGAARIRTAPGEGTEVELVVKRDE